MREAPSRPRFLPARRGSASATRRATRGSRRRPILHAAVLLSAGFLALPVDATAGTGRLVTQWMTRAPRIDGQIAPAEWDETLQVALGAGVLARFGNDGRTLYLAVLDTGNPTLATGDRVSFTFDDQGGVAPVLDDGAWTTVPCGVTPDLGEGTLYFRDEGVDYRERVESGTCPLIPLDGTSHAFSAQPEGVTYELAIPLDGPAPLRARRGERFGVLLEVRRDGLLVACLPGCDVLASQPSQFRNLVLASGGCNTGPQDFGSGEPLVGLPLDWTTQIYSGSAPGWVQIPSPPSPYASICNHNVTGGSGAAACDSAYYASEPAFEAALLMPLTLVAQETATLRLRAVFGVGDSYPTADDQFGVAFTHFDGSGGWLLHWQGQSQSATVLELPLPLPELAWASFHHATALGGGLIGGFAQVDDVELLCGPILFADGFESGLSTHWSATAP